MLSLSFVLLLFLQSPVASGPKPRDQALASRIEQLLQTVLTTNDDKQDEAAKAEVRKIFADKGLPTLSEVGDRASYDFVLLGIYEQSPEFEVQVLAQAKALAARHELPPDAAVFCEAHLRVTGLKNAARSHTPSHPSLRNEIEQLSKTDQAVRQKEGFDLKKMEERDKLNAAPLRAIFDKYGVPTYNMVGPQAAGDFVMMVQHQSPDFRLAILPKLKANVDAGQADPDSFALVYDRSHRDSGQKQLYGTQLECDATGQLREAPIEDEASVNQRRAALGLMRLELYAQLVKEMSPQLCPAGSAKNQ
jgi:hypothetical protein